MIITTKAPYRPCGRAGRPLTHATMEYFIPVETEENRPEREALRRLLRLVQSGELPNERAALLAAARQQE